MWLKEVSVCHGSCQYDGSRYMRSESGREDVTGKLP